MNKDNQFMDKAEEVAARASDKTDTSTHSVGYGRLNRAVNALATLLSGRLCDSRVVIADALRSYASEETKRAEQAEAERDALKAECLEQSRLLGISGERECALRGKIERLNHAYNKYIDMLVAELNEVVPIAMAHGWRTSRAEAGEKARAAIEDIK